MLLLVDLRVVFALEIGSTIFEVVDEVEDLLVDFFMGLQS